MKCGEIKGQITALSMMQNVHLLLHLMQANNNDDDKYPHKRFMLD